MSFATTADGIRIHYDVFGRRGAEPVLMIQGLGADSRGWGLQRPAIGRSYRGIVFDNRGVGRSGKPVGQYDLEQMADDAIAVLDDAGFDSAHVMGASMGGVIAQIIAVRYPERVRSLILACTACRHLTWRRELLEDWAALAQAQGMRAFAAANLRWLVGPRSLRRFWPAFGVLTPIAISAPTHSFVSQVHAILDMDDDLRMLLPTVTAPTLVLVGSQDILTPQADAEEIVELIPDAELAVVQGAAHGLMVEHFATFNRLVLDFLARVTAEQHSLELRRDRS
ncbi:MAG TPA: alpha/beta fold hydrolase [Acidimicrobiales bacterium]|jgi:3-oxoadipate enol-lactonase